MNQEKNDNNDNNDKNDYVKKSEKNTNIQKNGDESFSKNPIKHTEDSFSEIDTHDDINTTTNIMSSGNMSTGNKGSCVNTKNGECSVHKSIDKELEKENLKHTKGDINGK